MIARIGISLLTLLTLLTLLLALAPVGGGLLFFALLGRALQ